MKKLSNGNIEFYYEGGIWALVGGIVTVLAIIFLYCIIPFPKGERWVFIFMAAPLVVVAIMLFKNFFKPTARLTTSQEGVEFFRYQKVFNSKIKLPWNQITEVFFDRRQQTAKGIPYTVEVLLFKTFKKGNEITYEFEVPYMSMDDRKQLYSILKEHNFIIEELQHKPPTW